MVLPNRPSSGRAGSIIDFPAFVDTTVAASSYGNPFAQGTIFPLLPNYIVKIFNASALLTANETTRSLECDSLIVQAILSADDQANLIVAEFAIAQLNQSGGIVGPSGLAATSHGDPVVAFLSNLRVMGQQGIAAFFSLQASADVHNTDAVNPHDTQLFLTGVFDFVPA